MHRPLILTFSLFLIIALSCTDDHECVPGDPIGATNISGSWIRVESNNPSADGMITKIVGNNGVMTDKAGSGFSVGDVKWMNIVAVSSESFEHEELGSDYNYYTATMELQSDDTLRIMVGASGAGNQQKWVRDGEYTPGQGGPSVTTTISDNTREDRTLKNGPAEVDYIIDGVMDITATLTIEPGTVIEMAENAGFGVYDGGVINLVGTEAEPIIIRGTQSNNGWWRGIHVETASQNNALKHVSIDGAGANYVYCCNDAATIFLKRGARMSIENVQLHNGGATGILAQQDVQFDSYKNIKIESHEGYPLDIHAEVLTDLDGSGSDYSGNSENYAYISASSIVKESIWKKLNVPYRIGGKVLDIQRQLTIDAGVDIVFEAEAGLGIYDAGAITINGTSADPVVMRGLSDQKGFWRGIHLETNDSQNKFNYLQLSNAGSNYVYCCNDKASLFFKGGSASVTNCTISEGKEHGIIARSDFTFNDYANNTITSHNKEPLNISVNRLGDLDGTGSSYTGNQLNYIRISDSRSNQDITIHKTDIPYLVPTNTVVDITNRLTIMPGVDIAFAENAGLGVYDSGVFNCVGTSSNIIQLRGKDSTKGYWRGIHTETTSTSNEVSHTNIMHAGSNYVYCCNNKAALVVKGGTMKVQKCTITDNDGCGIYVYAAGDLTESNNTFGNNTDGDICN